MSIFEPHKLQDDKISQHQIEAVDKEKMEYKLIGSMVYRRGHTLFSYNRVTEEIKVVKPASKAALNLDGSTTISHEVQFEPKLMYIQALNKKNALRKFKKEI